MITNKKTFFLFSALILQVSLASAAKLVSSCAMSDITRSTLPAYSIRASEPMTIASVSKLFTSTFALSKFSLDYKFITNIFVTPVSGSKNLFDVHIQGSGDPYFNRYKMHMIISRLNEAKVFRIRQLTFDENVKYLHQTDNSSGFRVDKKNYVKPLILKADLDFPSKELVRTELSQLSEILKEYKISYKTSEKEGTPLYKNPQLSVGKVVFLSSTQFKPAPNALKIYVASQNMETIVKSMNWNSNNYAANRLMSISGGLDQFHKFMIEKVKLPSTSLRFVNGSGQNHELDGDGRLYNQASCESVVKTVRMLKLQVEKQNRKLEDVMSVVGVDVGSTVGGVTYSNAFTKDVVIAKTGTVGTNITLAGMINRPADPLYFMFNVELALPGKRVRNKAAFSAQEENRARKLISAKLTNLIRQVGGVQKLNHVRYNPLGESIENYDENTTDEVAKYIDPKAPQEPTDP